MDKVENALKLLSASRESDYRIAANTGITAASIGNYRNGKTKPTKANAMILINYFTNTASKENTQDIITNHNTPPESAELTICLIEENGCLRQQLGEQINENKHLYEKNMVYNDEIIRLKSEIGELKKQLNFRETMYQVNNNQLSVVAEPKVTYKKTKK
jgi:transcriptional regulator with XRE-family HTH domain